MRKIGITKYTTDKNKLRVSISKEVPYVLYNGEFVRVNVDYNGLSEEELEMFPTEVKADITDYHTRTTVKDSLIYSSYYKSQDINTPEKLIACIKSLATNFDLTPVEIYKYTGTKDSEGLITYDSAKVLALKVGRMYVPVFTISDGNKDSDLKEFVETDYLTRDVLVVPSSAVTLRVSSEIDISVVKNKSVVVTILSEDADYAKKIIDLHLL